MSETDESQSLPAADPAEAHETPGGNPAVEQNSDQSEPSATEPQGESSADVETTVETPGGTTVTERPDNGDLNGTRTATEDPSQHEGDVSNQSGRSER